MRIAVGMSGGVDSSAAAAILCKDNSVEGVTLSLWGENTADARDAAAVCQKLNINHNLVDLKGAFYERVIRDFIDEYVKGRTPNPCIQCNKHIKFGAMLDWANSRGFDKIATGHYAQIEYSGGRYWLKKAADISKDQSYVLYMLKEEQLSRILLPLGALTKAEIREIAEQKGLITAHKSDSQDICFVPDGDYAAFIKRETGMEFPQGDYVNLNGEKIGTHKGIIRYTIGQRKGLGIAMGHPVFVVDKDAKANTVTIGEEEDLFYTRVKIRDTSFIADVAETTRAAAKLRYRHSEQPCIIHRTGESEAVIEFSSLQRAPAPGQSAVFYDGEYVLGGGIIMG